MNHNFVAALDGTDKCAKCKYPELAHGDLATCECCPNIGKVEIRYGNMLMCNNCWNKEQELKAANYTPEAQQKRVDAMNAAMSASRQLDSSIEIRSDLFNAATVAIQDIEKLINDNPTITNKPYALAEILTERFQHFKKVVFDANEQILNASNNQKAIQVYLNTLANQLRSEEREKLKLSDINYKPSAPKPIKTVGTIKTRKSNKLDIKELAKYAKELGISDFTLRMVCQAQSITPEQAYQKMKKSINEAKAVSDNKPAVAMDELE